MTRLPTTLTVPTVLVAALLLASCSSTPDPESQQEARRGKDSRDAGSLFSSGNRATSRSALVVPPDLLSSSSDKVRGNQGSAGGSGEYQVLPEVIGATIHSDQDRSWLEIDADAEVVWRKLTEFWAFEEIELVDYKPEAGLMETDWFVKTQRAPNKGSVTSIAVDLFQAFISRLTAHDKFILRLQRNGSGGTDLYVTHRSREKISKEPGNKQEPIIFEWVERSQDPEKIAQLLQAIVLLFDNRAEGADAPVKTPA